MKASPRRYLVAVFLAAFAVLTAGGGVMAAAPEQAAVRAKPTPVLLDTDIGDDIDDTWALALLLRCPELDPKLVVGDYGRPQYRARLLAKFLQEMGRADIPIGVGVAVPGVGGAESQAKWLADYDLKSYPGKVHADGVQAMIDVIMKSPEPVTLIAIGPLPNVAAALAREPRIAQRARFVGMHGSVRRGYGGGTNVAAEWNVKCDPRAAQQVFSAPWEMVITPLDTCGVVDLFGEQFSRVRDSSCRAAQLILTNYQVWAAARSDLAPAKVRERSSTLFDCVAIYLATGQDCCRMEPLNLRVTDDGYTRTDPAGKSIVTATGWKDLNGFREWMVRRLTDQTPQPGAPAR